jgi:hypothetical protein
MACIPSLRTKRSEVKKSVAMHEIAAVGFVTSFAMTSSL